MKSSKELDEARVNLMIAITAVDSSVAVAAIERLIDAKLREKSEGIYLGCEGQEGLVELRNLFEKPGVPGRTGNAVTTFVPEPLVRNMPLYAPVGRTQ